VLFEKIISYYEFTKGFFNAKFVPKIGKRKSFRQISRFFWTRESFCP